MTTAFIVLQNSDFTEGRGIMLLHNVWTSAQEAIKYVEDQFGINGSRQYKAVKPWINQKDTRTWDYNGYLIQEALLRETYNPEARKQAEEKVKKLKQELEQAERELLLNE